MKKIFIILLFAPFFSFTQIQTPQPSPFSTLVQKVGLVDIKIEYSRPSARGRQIFGNLVPYNEVWRTGANKNTTIEFSDKVMIGEVVVPKGKYAIYTIPGHESWEIILYKKNDNWGLPQNWDKNEIAVKTSANSYELPYSVESFSIQINNLSNNGATIYFIWESTVSSFSINTLTRDKTISSIKNTLDKNPNSQNYYKAAVFYLEENLNMNLAKRWIDKSFELRKDAPYWMLKQKALIYLAVGDKEGALKIANKGLALAKETKLKDSVKSLSDTVEYILNN